MKKIKGLLCDLDNTLYDYEQTHQKAMATALSFFCDQTKLNPEEGAPLYMKARQQINSELKNTAASHNRLLYFQRMLELMDHRPLTCALDAYHCYWNTFIDNIELFDGVMDFFHGKQDRKITILTDLTAEIQHKKCHHLKLFDFIDYLVTSEEAGEDKPNAKMFQCALNKMDLQADEVLMIGDNYEKDMMGALHCGIKGLWLNRDQPSIHLQHDNIKEFSHFKDIQDYLTHA
ncbi:HAD family hydrolase [Candidatus Omnitrophota bacterium]